MQIKCPLASKEIPSLTKFPWVLGYEHAVTVTLCVQCWGMHSSEEWDGQTSRCSTGSKSRCESSLGRFQRESKSKWTVCSVLMNANVPCYYCTNDTSQIHGFSYMTALMSLLYKPTHIKISESKIPVLHYLLRYWYIISTFKMSMFKSMFKPVYYTHV